MFEKNYAVDSGGALKLRMVEVDNATIFNTTFKMNKAGSDALIMPTGGAVDVWDARGSGLTFSSCCLSQTNSLVLSF